MDRLRFLSPALLALALLLSPLPSAAGPGTAAPPPATQTAAGSGDRTLLTEVRRLAGAGDCRAALSLLEGFFGREERNTDLDWEAAILREICHPLRSQSPPPAPAAPSPAPPPPPAGEAAPQVRPAAPPPSSPPPPSLPRLAGVQVFVFRATTLGELEGEVERLAREGYDTLIVRAFHNIGDRPLLRGLRAEEPGVYFRSGTAPLVADVFTPLVAAARKRGIRVFGWMTTRRSDWLISRHPEWLEQRFDFALGGQVRSKSLSIWFPEVRAALRATFRDLAATGVDGILFQDDLILRHSEGFSPPARDAFLLHAGKSGAPEDLFLPSREGKPGGYRPLFREWCRWKNASLEALLSELTAAVREVNPRLLTAANLYYETILSPDNGLAWFAQSAPGLLERVDYLAVMSYHRQMKREMHLDDAEVAATLGTLASRARPLAGEERRIIFKIQTLDWDSRLPIPEDEWRSIRSQVESMGTFSVVTLQNL